MCERHPIDGSVQAIINQCSDFEDDRRWKGCCLENSVEIGPVSPPPVLEKPNEEVPQEAS